MESDKRWPGYETVRYYWHNQKAADVLADRDETSGNVYIVWARDKKDLRSRFYPWLRWLPAPILWRSLVWGQSNSNSKQWAAGAILYLPYLAIVLSLLIFVIVHIRISISWM